MMFLQSWNMKNLYVFFFGVFAVLPKDHYCWKVILFFNFQHQKSICFSFLFFFLYFHVSAKTCCFSSFGTGKVVFLLFLWFVYFCHFPETWFFYFQEDKKTGFYFFKKTPSMSLSVAIRPYEKSQKVRIFTIRCYPSSWKIKKFHKKCIFSIFQKRNGTIRPYLSLWRIKKIHKKCIFQVSNKLHHYASLSVLMKNQENSQNVDFSNFQEHVFFCGFWFWPEAFVSGGFVNLLVVVETLSKTWCF